MGYTLTQSQREEIEAERALKQKMLTPERFLMNVEKYAKEYDLSIIESVTEYCQENEIDIEFAAQELMSDRLFGLIEEDAEERNLLSKKRRKLKFV